MSLRFFTRMSLRGLVALVVIVVLAIVVVAVKGLWLYGAAIPVIWLSIWGLFRMFIPSRKLPRDRIRRMRFRLRLHLLPGRGFATLLALHLRFGGKSIARKHGSQIRPSLSVKYMKANPDSCSFDLGPAHLRITARLPLNRHMVVIAPPRQGKTGNLGDLILNYPGSVLATSTRKDLFENTSAVMAKRGPIETYNPQFIGDLPSTIRVNPVRGCAREQTAIRTAMAFAEAASGEGTDDQGFWEGQATSALAGLLCAADIVKADLRLVMAWGLGVPAEAVAILEAAGKLAMAQGLYEFAFSPAEKTTSTIRMVLKQCLGFMADPRLAECVLPASDAECFDFSQAVTNGTTLYLIGESEGKSAPVAGLFAWIASEWKYWATMAGSKMPGGKLDPPTLMALDEIAAICPLPLPQWLQDSGGKGIQIVTVIHGMAQLEGRWGQTGRRTVFDTSTILVLPGVKDPELLKMVSELCGDVLLKERGEEGGFRQYPLMSMDMIRSLPDFRGLLISDAERPVIVRLGMSWDAREVQDAKASGTDVVRIAARESAPMLSRETSWAELMSNARRALPEGASPALSRAIEDIEANDSRTPEMMATKEIMTLRHDPALAAITPEQWAVIEKATRENVKEELAGQQKAMGTKRLRKAYGPKRQDDGDTLIEAPLIEGDETVIEAEGEVSE